VTAAPGEAPVWHGLLGVFGSGDFLVVDRAFLTPSTPATEVTRPEHAVVRRFDPLTQEMDSIGALPRQDAFAFLHPPGEFDGFLTFGDLPFGRVESWALGERALFVGRGDHFEVEEFSAGGDLEARIRICEEPEPVRPEEMQRWVDDYLDGMSERGRALESAALAGIPLPTTEPALLEMLMDHAGRLWVRDFAPEWEEGTWRVFDPDGRWTTSLTLPAGLRVVDATGNRVLVVGNDELGVETVRVYGLEG
jgi:hypothetical protein